MRAGACRALDIPKSAGSCYIGAMSTTIELPVSKAIEALVRDLQNLGEDDARAVIGEARENARIRRLRQLIAEGDATESLDGPAAMAELLAEAQADVEAAQRRGEV